MRMAARDSDENGLRLAQKHLSEMPARRCLRFFLGELTVPNEPSAGWIYILSTREIPDLLKIGMTTRTVLERVREINNATGVAIPFGVRRCWRVTDPGRSCTRAPRVGAFATAPWIDPPCEPTTGY
jgi:hypothetical protein